jgi:hypothetical protein
MRGKSPMRRRRPEEKCRERANVQSREDQNVIYACFLKVDDAVTLQETPVAQQHGASESSFVRSCCKKNVERSEKAATHSGKPVGKS